MTAIRTNRTWIKFLVVIFLVVIGIAGVYYAYTAYVNPPRQEEKIEEEVVPEEPETVYRDSHFLLENSKIAFS